MWDATLSEHPPAANWLTGSPPLQLTGPLAFANVHTYCVPRYVRKAEIDQIGTAGSEAPIGIEITAHSMQDRVEKKEGEVFRKTASN